jgi:hypothetical protein
MEHVMAVGAQDICELGLKGISDLVGLSHILLVVLPVKEVNMI